MKKLLILLLTSLLFFSCSEQKTKASSPKLSDAQATTLKKNLSWVNYHKYCGEQNLYAAQNFKKLKGTVVRWKGEFAMTTNPVNKSSAVAPEIKVKLKGGSGVISDLTMRSRKEHMKIAEKLERGDEVLFQGKIMYRGEGLGDHVLQLDKFKYLPPKEPKKIVR
ncbi:hypothetical protein LNTAR_03574 [Lentisphaera araneosa HTCC2155]|jgi:hypothetical protein|uniref:Lipoprotein n=1 Tax=Lentisphaera araneosa HTCC2155 TaxID=313628 RepID=A6DSS3_9BACT|nr:hypothetical protein [Lentisphaera araneosa]EDM25326.1 hypothetical protein LNTAR_03574 [Lentisphaera araneosa HTCC2155]